jgi:hypothetical protein
MITPMWGIKPREVALKTGLRLSHCSMLSEWPGVSRDSAGREVIPYQLPNVRHVTPAMLGNFIDPTRWKIAGYEYYLPFLVHLHANTPPGGNPLASGPIVEASSMTEVIREKYGCLIAKAIRTGRELTSIKHVSYLEPGTKFLVTAR